MRHFSLWDVLKLICLITWTEDHVLADVGYKRLGCYNDKEQEDRPLPELLFTDRDELSPTYSGKKYTKENYDRPYLDDLVERCALKSKKMGYTVFGIERFAECHSGDGAWETYKKDGPSRQCFTSKYEPCDFECEAEPCAGTDHTIFVYKIGPPSRTTTTCSSHTKKPPASTKPTQPTQVTTVTPIAMSKRTRPTSKPSLGPPPKRTLPTSSSTKPMQTKSAKPTTSWLPSSRGTNPITKRQSTRGVFSRPTKLPSRRRTSAPEKTTSTTNSPITKATTLTTKTVRITKTSLTTKAIPRSTSIKNTPTKNTPTSPVTSEMKYSHPTYFHSTRPSTATPGTTPATSTRPSQTMHITFTKPDTTPIAAYNKNPSSQISCCMQYIPEPLICPPLCKTSCSTICHQACCMVTPRVYPAFPVFPQLATVSRYQCPYPCPNACAPRCSSKCCSALYYRTPLFRKRKHILRKGKKQKLRSGRKNLLKLKQKSSEKKNASEKAI